MSTGNVPTYALPNTAVAPTPSECHFIRTSHDHNGHFRPQPPQAYQFWQQHGHIVLSVLRSETGMPFSAIVTACRELAEEQADCTPFPEEDEKHVAWVLLKLVEHGLAAVVDPAPQPIHPPHLTYTIGGHTFPWLAEAQATF